jgi:hypothetical protein
MHFDLEESAVSDIGQRLRDLAAANALPMDWDEFKRRQLRRNARLHAARRLQVAVIATLALSAFGAMVIWNRLPASRAILVQRSEVRVDPTQYQLAPVARDEAAARSAASERWLAALPAEPVIVRVGTRAAVTNLEDRIAWVDDTLTLIDAEGGEGARTSALQHERERLINSLAQVRYAETLVADLP